ncbi:MAG: hypothetical protein JXA10_13070 [Anaerolineae bacterium]|nr:hypothetical protein [Anaerolineae bacterium]
MNLLDLLTPWFSLAAILVPLVYVEKWIHSHLYGVGWLLTEDDKSATALYYVLLFPGVFLHEFTQYLMAGALNVKIERMIQWPEAQKNGTLRLDFVKIKEARWFQAALIGATPLITGMALVWVISSQILGLNHVVAAIQAQDSARFQTALTDLASTPDFFLWMFLIFTISNAMLPTPADRQGWPLLFAAFAGVIGVLLVIGVGDVLYERATGPWANAIENVTTAFAMVLVVELPGIIFIGFIEEVLERITKRKFNYRPARAEAATGPPQRVPGSNLPLPPGAPLPSLYNIHLPVPEPPAQLPRRSSRRRSAAAKTASKPMPAAPMPKAAEKQEAIQPGSATARSSRPKPSFSSSSAPRAQSDRARSDRLADQTQQPRRVARPADPPQTSRTPSRAANYQPDERRAQPLSSPRQDATSQNARRVDVPRSTDERRAQPLNPARQDAPAASGKAPDTGSHRASQDRARFGRPSRGVPLSSRARAAKPDESQDTAKDTVRDTTRETPDRFLRRSRPFSRRRDQPAAGAGDQAHDQVEDQTQRLDQTGRLNIPSSNRPRPDIQGRRLSPFVDDDDEEFDDLYYEDDPDMAQDIPDDE